MSFSEIKYLTAFVDQPNNALDTLMAELDFEHRDGSPRKEFYMNDYPVPYTYGSGGYEKTFLPKSWHPLILDIRHKLESEFGCVFNVCFVNLYENEKHFLGWHADNSPEMDDEKPIVTVSLGAEREIWFRENGEVNPKKVHAIRLGNGSACAMPPGFQDTHEHRIPKNDRPCGPRMSLTFRGYVVANPNKD